MSEHEHEKECKHKKVRYCRACDVAFCRKCGREWGKKVWHYQYQDAVYIGRAGQPGYDWAGRPIVTNETVTFPTPITTTTSNEHVECESSASWFVYGGDDPDWDKRMAELVDLTLKAEMQGAK